jgi:hypothetical protein
MMMTLIPWVERGWSFNLPAGAFPAVLERLAGTPPRAAALIAGVPEAILGTRPTNTWSVKEHLGHLSDLHELDMRRLDEFLAGAAILTAADMSNKLTEERNHRATSMADLLKILRDDRQRLILRLENVTEADIRASALHPRLGIRVRLIDWAQLVAEHDNHHLAAARLVLRSLIERLP